jgi:RHS repeat-associated protein
MSDLVLSETTRYTGKERDTESGLDHFQFRSYASTMGRWMSPDPAGMMAADIEFPQTLNRYAYVNNNPLGFTDPLGLDCAYLNNSGSGVESFDQHSSSGECGKTGGYWVDGGLTDAKINADKGTVQLTGTNNGTDQTHASYQDTTVQVGMYANSFWNPAGHIAFGLGNGPRYGLNPASDSQFMKYAISRRIHGKSGGGSGVPGAVQTQVGGQIRGAVIPVTGMQANIITNGIIAGYLNPPNYDAGGGQPTCDCASWPQQVLGDAGINTGRRTEDPGTLINQITNIYPQ